MISKFIDRVRSLSKWKKAALVGALFFVSFSLFFPAGALTNNAMLENAAYQIADIAKRKTKDGIYVPFIVEPKTEEEQMYNTFTEYFDTRSKFRGHYSRFAGTVNAKKTDTITWNDVSENNFSFIYVSTPGFNNKQIDDHWTHEYYPINLMFKGEHKTNDDALSFLYISKSNADTYLLAKNREATPDNYRWLLGQNITLDFNSESYTYTIANIMLEDTEYYNDLHSVMGDFFLGYNKYPTGFQKQSLYFLTENVFQNLYYIQYAKTLYDHSKFNYFIGTSNLIGETSINENSIIENIIATNNETGSIILFVLSFVLMTFAIYFAFKTKTIYCIPGLLIICGSITLPYLLFKIIFLISENIVLFSYSATTAYMFSAFTIAIMTICCIVLTFFQSRKRYAKTN